MLFRNFRRITTNQWLDVLLTVNGDAFSGPSVFELRIYWRRFP